MAVGVLDYIRRKLITSGELKRLIEEDGFARHGRRTHRFRKRRSAGSTDYTDFLDSLKSKTDLDAKARYELLAIRDIQDARFDARCTTVRQRKDGFVSLEVSPWPGTRHERDHRRSRRLWKVSHRDNVMIKVPGTGRRSSRHPSADQ